MRYRPKNSAALQLALGGLPNNVRVEVDPDVGVSAKTVGELRKSAEWSEHFAITTPEQHYPGSVVKISKASAPGGATPKP